MRLCSLLLVACFFMLAQASAFAQISSNSTQNQVRYNTAHPLHYRIANFDPRLKISQQQMIDLSKQAAAIWEKDTGQHYFVYDPEAEFSIHLVFDQRQIRSMKRAESLNQLEHEQQIWLNENQQLQQLKQNVAQSKLQLELQKTEYQTRVENQQQHKQRSSIKTLFTSIQKQQQDLEQQSVQLQNRIAKHQQLVQQLDLQTEKSKQLYQQLTQSIAEFNQTFKPQTLHKGQFDGDKIFIYEFSSIDDLRLTLAHEFGHALGLKHTQDPKSLMYPRIKSQDAKDFKLTNTDLELLGFSR
ncbi:M10 family metallopeptidase domain-containing protein [Acinetobacter sp. NIPH 1852]|uniref:matrixin family metalloprotease n=1 Tax=Acinetobacter sp. NIPH 1852 TaxID=2923428 RepID=UPI001F4AD291|nr:matrixin family metalloprotease [Acinetobacter sp. NIPH 1852]MCH7309399.1 M10 family metallopeptidase domain-containing protein [Acinetobacter sp. NIPH 1852]